MGVRRRRAIAAAGAGAAIVVIAAIAGAARGRDPGAPAGDRSARPRRPAAGSEGAQGGGPPEALLVQKIGEAEIDWQRGFLIARAGAAADIRLPGPTAARPEAERRARARALEALRSAAAAVPLGGGRRLDEAEIARALGTPKVLRVEYQSNGGVLLDLGLDFATLVGAPAADCRHEDRDAPGHDRHHPELAPVVVEASRARLEVAPALTVGGREVRAGLATYRLGAAPADGKPIAARPDKQGRLAVAAGAVPGPEALAGRRLVIYARALDR